MTNYWESSFSVSRCFKSRACSLLCLFLLSLQNVVSTPLNTEVDSKATPEAVEESLALKAPQQSQVEVKVIPLVSDVFTQAEDLYNMTPLKLATAISAQYLLTSIQNIPVAGDSLEDTFNMLEGVVKDLNKTAQVIKLTAEYVNISSHYILSTLNQFPKDSCERRVLQEEMKSVNKDFLKTITEHVFGAVKELNEKSRQREMTGKDILISSAYHIVTAFQEMTNRVLTITGESINKCRKFVPNLEITPPSGDLTMNTEKKTKGDIFTAELVPEQGKSHKSIKKDQAVPLSVKKPITQIKSDNFDSQFALDNLKDNQDLTVEVFSPEAFFSSSQKLPVVEEKQGNNLNPPKAMRVRYIPLKSLPLFKDPLNIDEKPKEQVKAKVLNKTKNLDVELSSSNVDSLSNVPWGSPEFEAKSFDRSEAVKNAKTPQSLINVLELMVPGFQKSVQFQPKEQCDEHVAAVCGIDKKNKKFIIFLNDCKRESHNKLHGTNYEAFKMETCVGLFLHNPSLGAELSAANQQPMLA